MPVSNAFIDARRWPLLYTRVEPNRNRPRDTSLICARPRLAVEKQCSPKDEVYDSNNPTSDIQGLSVFVRNKHDASYNFCNETISHKCRVRCFKFRSDQVDYRQCDKCQRKCVEHLYEWSQVKEKKSFWRDEGIGGIYIPSNV